jgi:hypothetical protein
MIERGSDAGGIFLICAMAEICGRNAAGALEQKRDTGPLVHFDIPLVRFLGEAVGNMMDIPRIRIRLAVGLPDEVRALCLGCFGSSC